MAAPTPTTKVYQTGRAFVATWHAVWANIDNHTDSIVVDLSGLDSPYTNRIRILKIHVTTTTGISATLEWDDATADVLIYRNPVGVVGNIVLDYTDIEGLIWDDQTSADTGDILVTTSSAASGDEVSIVVVGRCS